MITSKRTHGPAFRTKLDLMGIRFINDPDETGAGAGTVDAEATPKPETVTSEDTTTDVTPVVDEKEPTEDVENPGGSNEDVELPANLEQARELRRENRTVRKRAKAAEASLSEAQAEIESLKKGQVDSTEFETIKSSVAEKDAEIATLTERIKAFEEAKVISDKNALLAKYSLTEDYAEFLVGDNPDAWEEKAKKLAPNVVPRFTSTTPANGSQAKSPTDTTTFSTKEEKTAAWNKIKNKK